MAILPQCPPFTGSGQLRHYIARNSVLLTYDDFYAKSLRILDMGCGEGSSGSFMEEVDNLDGS